jgi:hypothetical protein
MLVQSELVSIFNELLNQRARLRKGGVQATYHCPFCVDKNLVTQKFEIALAGPKIGYYHCWRCNSKGKTFGTLLKKLNAPDQYRKAIFKLTGDIRIARNYKRNSKTSVTLPEEFHPLSIPRNTPEYRNALNYLKKRGILLDDILRYNIGYCETGDYAYRIIWPSYDVKGMLNFFVGRYYYETEGILPYVKADVENIVGFESFLNYNEPITLCEGVFDAAAIRNNASPLFGKYPSKKLREQMILNGTKRVNMILDDDALSDAIKNCELLMRDIPDVDVHLVRLPKKDPSLLGFEKIHDLIRKSRPITFGDLLAYRLKI